MVLSKRLRPSALEHNEIEIYHVLAINRAKSGYRGDEVRILPIIAMDAAEHENGYLLCGKQGGLFKQNPETETMERRLSTDHAIRGIKSLNDCLYAAVGPGVFRMPLEDAKLSRR